MSNLIEIERAVESLGADQLAAFRAWFADYDADVWDQQIETDVADGRQVGIDIFLTVPGNCH